MGYLGAAVGLAIALLGLAYGFGLFKPKKPAELKAAGERQSGAGAKPQSEKKETASAAKGKPADKGKAAAAERKPADKGKAAEKKPADKKEDPKAADKGKAAGKKPAEEKVAESRPRLVSELLEDSEDDVTIVTLAPRFDLTAAVAGAKAADKDKAKPAAAPEKKPAAAPEKKPAAALAADWPMPDEDDEDEAAPAEKPIAVPILYDEDAAIDEPTRASALILIAAASQTDRGRRRRRNEDSLLVLDDHHLYVVADGMGGHSGGEVASKMAVETIGEAFKKNAFPGEPYPDVPRRGGELAIAIQLANQAIYERQKNDEDLAGMGTTVVAARFTPNKQRLYVGHVGDSRCYRLRAKELTPLTTDHTMGASGITGPLASHLLRAVGIAPAVKVDLIIGRPRPEDVYLLCSDGLTKMVSDEKIRDILLAEPNMDRAVEKLVETANAGGGRDNITVILVAVKDPRGLSRYVQNQKSGSWAP